jgi:MoaA/NifB/PqqE/SkfB family radical SAM enzyme
MTAMKCDTGVEKLSVWEYAGLMVTYWCNARCAFCYVYSAPDRGGDMTVERALHLWHGLDRLAGLTGKKMRIHLSGGEPMGDWPRLAAIIRAARDAGLTPLEKVETNAFWATEDNLTRARLELLDGLGLEKLIISADVYHQEYVPIERVARCTRIARQVLGRSRVRVRWWDTVHQPAPVHPMTRAERVRTYHAALARHNDRLTGRAAERLAGFFECFPAEHFAGQTCVSEVLGSRHVHIDPYGNVFPGVCSGIILGNAAEREVDELWRELAENWHENPVLDAVVSGGSFELMRRAQRHGYRSRQAGYANKCHLCTHVRQFLVERGGWERYLGPAECYANVADKRDAARQPAAVGLPVLSRQRVRASLAGASA